MPSRFQLAAMAVALMFLAASLGYALGARRDGAPGGDSVDVGFLRDMVTHHRQAIRLSNLELQNGSEPGVQVFAREILYAQSYEIGGMDSKLAEWRITETRPPMAMAWMGNEVPAAEMPGLASPAELELLETSAGRDADALFVALMQDHHRGGVHMAEYAAKHANSEFVRDIAGTMAAAQKLEIGEMTLARRRLGLPERPPGFEAAVIPETTEAHDGH